MEKPPSRPEQNQQIVQELDEMFTADQQMREKDISEGVWDESVDARSTARIKEIVAAIGWPTKSKVGEKASHQAWLLVQHADRNVAFQSECLALMKREPTGEVSPRDIAMLEDRVRINSGQPQLYGTQFREINGEHKPLPIEDEEHVNERRKEMGLGPLEEGISTMYKKYGSPNQG